MSWRGDEGTGGMELVAGMEAPREEAAGQSILMQTELLVSAWLQNVLSPMEWGGIGMQLMLGVTERRVWL